MLLHIKQLLLPILLCCAAFSSAQQHTTINFENNTNIYTTKGIIGKAFDLGDVPKRYAIDTPNPVKNLKSFSVSVWVKAAANGKAAYTILSSLEKTSNGFNGWKFGVQANGAWNFTIASGRYSYAYNPTPGRQSIRDGQWHLLAVTYAYDQHDLSFYYDGKQMAIYNAPGLDSVNANTITIGNALDNDTPDKTREWETFYGAIDDISLSSTIFSNTEIENRYYSVTQKKKPALQKNPSALTHTSFNIWHGGHEEGKEVGLERIIQLLTATHADIFTLVETYGSAEVIADRLGYYVYLISTNLSIMSRYPFTETHLVYKAFNSGGATIRLPDGQLVNVFAVWLHYLPNYWSTFLDSKPVNMQEYMIEENKTRGNEMNAILGEIQSFTNNADNIPIILSGDFNSGSHLDWTSISKDKHNGYVVEWPTSVAMYHAGFKDVWRTMHPDVLQYPGITWSPLYNEGGYIKDRIDYIYYKGSKLKVVYANTITSHPVKFPSDHGAVTAKFEIRKK
ncbi:MAG: endonuclease/exonuclease/phosphatase family protein [Agriterribacter sp.]